MVVGKAGDGNGGSFLSRPSIVTLLVGLLAGTGGSLTFNMFTDHRPDPFTGTEGKAMREEIKHLKERHHKHEEDLTEVKLHDARLSQELEVCKAIIGSGISREHDKISEMGTKFQMLHLEFEHLVDNYEELEGQYDDLESKYMRYRKSHPDGALRNMGIKRHEAIGGESR